MRKFVACFLVATLLLGAFAPSSYDAAIDDVDISSEVLGDAMQMSYLTYGKWYSWGDDISPNSDYGGLFGVQYVDQDDVMNARFDFYYDLGVIIKPNVRVRIEKVFRVEYDQSRFARYDDFVGFTYKAESTDGDYSVGLFPTYSVSPYGGDGSLLLSIEFVTPRELTYIDFSLYFNIHFASGVNNDSIYIVYGNGPSTVVLSTFDGNTDIDGTVNTPSLPNVDADFDLDTLPSLDEFVPPEDNPLMIVISKFTGLPVVLNELIIVSVMGVLAYVVFGKRE